jgi:hypothetical protein
MTSSMASKTRRPYAQFQDFRHRPASRIVAVGLPAVSRISNTFWKGIEGQIFADEILPLIPAHELEKLCKTGGRPLKELRPPKELRTYAGLKFFQFHYSETGRGILRRLADSRILQRALHIHDWNDDTLYISERVRRDFLRRALKSKAGRMLQRLAREAFKRGGKVDDSVWRTDSVVFRPYMKRLSRAGLLFKTAYNFLKGLRKRAPEAFPSVPAEVASLFL